MITIKTPIGVGYECFETCSRCQMRVSGFGSTAKLARQNFDRQATRHSQYAHEGDETRSRYKSILMLEENEARFTGDE